MNAWRPACSERLLGETALRPLLTGAFVLRCSQFIEMNFDLYLHDMRANAWGGNVEIQALSQIYGYGARSHRLPRL